MIGILEVDFCINLYFFGGIEKIGYQGYGIAILSCDSV